MSRIFHCTLKEYGFGDNFLEWLTIVLKSQKSTITNRDHNPQYFRVERGARKGASISAYLFIFVLELLLILIKSNKRIRGIKIFSQKFLYTAYGDDTNFFLKPKIHYQVNLSELLFGQV